MTDRRDAIAAFVRKNARFGGGLGHSDMQAVTCARFEKALALLPEDVMDLLLSRQRSLAVIVTADSAFPMGMTTSTEGLPGRRRYTIVVYDEHQTWSEDHFLGAFLRELGHVVAERPPEEEWPPGRGERSRYKERLECRADAMVWSWGLRHYSMSHLNATYPPHWVDRIVEDISKMVLDVYVEPGNG